jgi:ATP synthase protein I
MNGHGKDAAKPYDAAKAHNSAYSRAHDRAYKQAAREGRAQGLGIGYSVFSYLVAGMMAYGAIGWGVGRAVHLSILFPIGMLVGLAISTGYVIYRYGRQGSEGNDR